ncbi:YhgE/Pip family protein [Salinibacterium sp. ZJ77]|uniref:YhgE/Pip family protein n=1 Tax=Salinibacterium sp. ZJ77 TaxID=2708337 RepID=UPI00141DDB80|nr:YhgE/Pip family protein [Salinibacterium sp. ZJ77]
MSQDGTQPTRVRRPWRLVALIAAAVVPLAFAGLTMASLADTEDGIHRIPAAIVNNDEMVTQTAEDGTETMVLAGRLLVTELTGSDSPGMQWRLSNADEAEELLAAGEVYAVLTIPSDFSASVVSLSSTDPVQARLSLETDDAHSYLAGAAAQSLGEGMVRTFGSQLTEQYISGIYTQFGTVGEAFTTAADGATQLADGATTAASGATGLADGVDQYTNGVAALSRGLQTMTQQTGRLGTLGSGLQDYISGVGSASGGLTQLTGAMAQDPRFTSDPTLAPYLQQLQAISGGLATAAQSGPALSQGAGSLGSLADGIADAANGAARLSSNGPSLDAGARDLATGLGELSTGATTLADGLQSGAARLDGTETVPTGDAAAVAADPVGLDVTTVNPVSQIGQVIGTYFVPLGLWVGALAIFLVMAPLSRRILATTAASGRVLLSALARAGIVAAVQAALLVLLMHLVADVQWSLLPVTLAFSLVAATAFTAFHQLLTVGFGRAGLVLSLLLLSVQVAAVSGVLPAQALAGPFSWLGGALPLGWATTGLQQIVAGGSAAAIAGSIAALALFGLVSIGLSRWAIGRARRANARTLLLPATA